MKDTTFRASEVVESLTWFPISEEVEAAYDAPFPSREYMAGVRVFPSLINQMPGLNEDAWDRSYFIRKAIPDDLGRQ
jgi:haloalkane dehalogenase